MKKKAKGKNQKAKGKSDQDRFADFKDGEAIRITFAFCLLIFAFFFL